MKFLTLKTIAVLMIIAIGFMVAEPFVEKTADASCSFYPASLCNDLKDICEERLQWADFNCPGANDAGVDRCNELTEEAAGVCLLAAVICYHAESD